MKSVKQLEKYVCLSAESDTTDMKKQMICQTLSNLKLLYFYLFSIFIKCIYW